LRRDRLIHELLQSKDPSIRWRVRVGVLRESQETAGVRRLEKEIRRSIRVRRLLSHRADSYPAEAPWSVYRKWQGVHWILASLVELGYPPGDPSLKPLIDRALQLWLRPSFFRTYPASSRASSGWRSGVPVIRGRARWHGSQQGSALRYVTALSWPDERCARLADLLLRWQWPDGGWNCDTHAAADSSSFMETLLPMRGLASYAEKSGDVEARRAARNASEVFLRRMLFRRQSDREVMDPRFLKLHYPLYWHYDVLGGLKGIAEVGRIRDRRCSEALDWLESRELPGGGWPADAKYYQVSKAFRPSGEFVEWGRTGHRARNDWVTTDALQVLAAAGRVTG
jgi:hypothetical protein